MEQDILSYLAVAVIAFMLGRMSVRRGERVHSGTTASHQSVDEYIAALSDDARLEIDSLMRDRKKISAIKIFRENTGAGLKDAKDAVERMWPGQ